MWRLLVLIGEFGTLLASDGTHSGDREMKLLSVQLRASLDIRGRPGINGARFGW
jgi:hypothetical protein